ncbi:MAG: methyltransferase type 12, partial [Thermomicrobiales bacterium]
AIALQLGANLIATDYAAESLTLTRLTCLLNGEAEPVTVRVNWRDTSDPLLDGSQTFPVILAADVLYERRDIEPLLALFDRLLAPGGVVLLAEPGREPARLFLDHADTQGWQREVYRIDGPWPDPKDEAVVVRIHRLSRVSVPSNP